MHMILTRSSLLEAGFCVYFLHVHMTMLLVTFAMGGNCGLVSEHANKPECTAIVTVVNYGIS